MRLLTQMQSAVHSYEQKSRERQQQRLVPHGDELTPRVSLSPRKDGLHLKGMAPSWSHGVRYKYFVMQLPCYLEIALSGVDCSRMGCRLHLANSFIAKLVETLLLYTQCLWLGKKVN